MKKSLFGLALLGSTALSFGIPGLHGEVSVGGISQNPSGYIQYPADTGTKLDVEKDLGLDRENRVFARAKLEIPLVPNLYLQYIPVKFEGRTNRTFTYGGTTFTGDVKTTVKYDRYDIGLYYNLILATFATNGLLDPEIGINVRVIDFKGKITELNTNRTESKSMTVPIPMAYFGLGINLPSIQLVGELRGIAYSGHKYYDMVGEVRVKPISISAFTSLFIGLGYRYEELKLDDLKDVNAKLKVKGPFIHAGISF
ncbi:MAG: TIGR04219 family outer membrane beta-barrel protein [Aquificae bacterium]|nr:TIGR04219 family outer membrane beta-barrel protein [Aquificota bacterium]